MKNTLSYNYVGSKEIAERVEPKYEGTKITQVREIFDWVKHADQTIVEGKIIATYIISEEEKLVINDRHSEHVMCAGGRKVLSAGEITFSFDKEEVYVSGLSNQSTGYCPKSTSWEIVVWVLDKIGIKHPSQFTQSFEFRYCENCQTKSLIKENIFECAVCESDLDLEWNIDKMPIE